MLQPIKKKRRGRVISGEIRAFLRSLATLLGIALFVTTLIAQPIRVEGRSMMNALFDQEMMLVTKFDYLLEEPNRFDVVICRYPGRGRTNFVKRIVGIPGDRIAIQGGLLFVNGEAMEETYLAGPADYLMEEITVSPGHYFVLGDNRANSSDSHLPAVGQLPRGQILGRVRLVLYPFEGIRAVR